MKRLIFKILSAIKRFFAKYWREAGFAASVLGFITIAYYFTYERPEDRFEQSLMILGMMVFGALSVFFFRLVWKKKWKEKVTEGLQKVFARLQRIVERVSTKLGLNKRSKKSVLEGKTKIIFEKSVERETKRVKTEPKPPKWGRLNDNRERVRYLYRGMANDKIRRGERIYRFETPNELGERQKSGSAEKKLIEVYSSCRYDERKSPDPKTVAELKRELNI